MCNGCAADAQRPRSITTDVVEANKDRCANDAAPNLPQNPTDAPPPPPARILRKIVAEWSVIGHGISRKDIPIMARLAKARHWSKQ